MYVSQIPIPPATPPQQKELETLVTRILTAKKADPAADIHKLEREIDERVYKLYGLKAEEVKIVESASSSAKATADTSRKATQTKGGGPDE